MPNQKTKLLPEIEFPHAVTLAELKEKSENDIEPCIRCDEPMIPIRGSKKAICANCGYKNDCC